MWIVPAAMLLAFCSTSASKIRQKRAYIVTSPVELMYSYSLSPTCMHRSVSKVDSRQKSYKIHENGREMALYSEKRHKEALFGKKFDKKPTSSQIKHHRIVGRGGGLPRLGKVTKVPTQKIKLPNRRCALLGKMDNTKARHVSHSGHRTHRHQRVNLHYKKIWHPGKKYFIRLRLSMKGLKTIKRLGLIEAARRFNLNIDKPKLFAGYAKHRTKVKTEEQDKYKEGYYADLDEEFTG